MEHGRDEQLARLEQLAAELAGSGYAIEWTGRAVPEVEVSGPADHSLVDRVQCRPDASGQARFWWPWNTKQPIGPASDIGSAAARIMAVLRPVEGQP